MKKFGWFLSIFAILLLSTAPVSAATYKIDQDHTSVSFKIRHILSNVQGQFNKFEGTFDYEPDKPETWKAQGTIEAASIDTNVEPRDKHLRSADFFDVEKYPTISFKTTGVKEVSGNTAKVDGLLEVHGVEKPVVLDVEIHGVAKDPWGNVRASFTATTKINRKDFGLNWNEVLETGQLLVGEEVKITLEVEGILA
jgi:polyisoprenoid-binding protein YceI